MASIHTKNKRSLLANIAEELARRPLVGDEKKCGPDLAPILAYFPRDDMSVGFDWCASFVYHCCQCAGFVLPIRYPDPVPCRFAGVNAWLVWAQLPETGFYHPAGERSFAPRRGDLIVFDNIVGNGPHDHIGVVLRRRSGVIETAEGNIDNRSGIFRRDRYQNVNGYIRIKNGYVYAES